MTWNVDRLVREFGLRRDTAAEIIGEQTRQAMWRNWQPWTWLVTTVPLAAWAIFEWRHDVAGMLALCAAMFGWHWIGMRMAQPAIAAAARTKAARIAGSAR